MRRLGSIVAVVVVVAGIAAAQTRVTQYVVNVSSHFRIVVDATSTVSLTLSSVVPICSEATFVDLYLANFDAPSGADVWYRLDGRGIDIREVGVPVVAGDKQYHRVPYYPKNGVIHLIGSYGASSQTVRGLLVVRP